MSERVRIKAPEAKKENVFFQKRKPILRQSIIQPKLTIGRPNDKYEQEANRVAEQVMKMPEPKVQRQPT